jgi:hypothetical protein
MMNQGSMFYACKEYVARGATSTLISSIDISARNYEIEKYDTCLIKGDNPHSIEN